MYQLLLLFCYCAALCGYRVTWHKFLRDVVMDTTASQGNQPWKEFEPAMSRIRDRIVTGVRTLSTFACFSLCSLLKLFVNAVYICEILFISKYKGHKINLVGLRYLRLFQYTTIHLQKDSSVGCLFRRDWRCDIFSSHPLGSLRAVT